MMSRIIMDSKIGVTNRKVHRLNFVFQSKVDVIEQEMKEETFKYSEGGDLIADISRKTESSG